MDVGAASKLADEADVKVREQEGPELPAKAGAGGDPSDESTPGSKCVMISFGSGGSGASGNLQDSFARYRKQKVLQARLAKATRGAKSRDPEFKAELRRKFVERAKSYFGVPYAQKYHEPGAEAYDAPFFLDCCGLVRRIMDDLQEDFGFRIGRWNQAYMFDTLPKEVELSEMQPGDLVFYSGTYTNPKAKAQKHDMVHVEIFTGGETGEQTIGARWQKGRVQYFDSYKFKASSYVDVKHYFRSLDTWLDGMCVSHCAEHEWKIEKWDASKRSVFYAGEEDEDLDAGEGAGDEDGAVDAREPPPEE